jgi:polysaccharide biosynthesis protein PslH
MIMVSSVSLAAPRAGDGIRILALAEHFSSKCELTLLSPTPANQLPSSLARLSEHWHVPLRRRGAVSTAIRIGMLRAPYDAARFHYRLRLPRLAADYFDVAYIHQPQGWALWERMRVNISARLVVADLQNDEPDMWFQRARAETHWLLRIACLRLGDRSETRFRTLLRDANLVMCVSDRDRETLLGRHGPSYAHKVRLVPNGVDVAYFKPPDHYPRSPKSVVFVGSLNTRMNQKAVDALLLVWPTVLTRIPEAALTIAGRNPPRRLARITSPSVRVVSSPADIRPFLWGAGAFVAPFLVGGGTKIKILEAMAACTPVVASPAAVQGLPMIVGTHYVSIDRIDEIPDVISGLLLDSGRTAAIAAEAAKLALEFDWSGIATRALEMVRNQVPART